MFAYPLMLALGAALALAIEHRKAIYQWYLNLRTNGLGL